MLRNVTATGLLYGFLLTIIVEIVLNHIVVDIIYGPIEPYLSPILKSLLPGLYSGVYSQYQSLSEFLTQENITLFEYFIRRDIERAIIIASIGLVDSTELNRLTIMWMFLAGIVAFLVIQHNASRKRLIENENPMKRFPKIVQGVFMAVFVLALLYVMNEFRIATPAVLMNKLFSRNLSIIAPYISLEEEKELKSKWALMKSRQDLRAIDDKMLTVMKNHGIPVKDFTESSAKSPNESP
jgi:hypothetical protein